MYQAAYKGLHSTDPNAVVMGVTAAMVRTNTAWLKRLAPLGIGQYLDGLTIHGYYDAGTSPSHPPERLATDPDSSFVRTLVVQRPSADRVTTLRARTLSVVGPDLDVPNVVVSSEDELATTLEDVFGIDPAALGAERTSRLWTAACAQHEAFLARRP